MCNWINAAFQENETGIFSVCSSYSSWRILLSDYINENQTLTWQLLLHYWKCDPTRRREGFWWSNLGSLQAEPWRFLPSRWTPLYPRCGPAASAVKTPGKSYQWLSWKTFLKTLALLHLIVAFITCPILYKWQTINAFVQISRNPPPKPRDYFPTARTQYRHRAQCRFLWQSRVIWAQQLVNVVTQVAIWS